MGNDPLATLEDEPGAGPDPFATGGAATPDEDFEAAVPTEEELGLPPAGNEKWVLQVIAISKEISKSSGNPMFKWETRIISDSKGDTRYAGFEPKPIYTVLGAKAAWKMDAVCRVMGLKPGDDNVYRFKRDDVMGVLFLAELDADEFNGQPQRQVGEMHPHPNGAGTKAEIQQVTAEGTPF